MEKNKFSLYFLFISIFTSVTIFVFMVQKGYENLIKPSDIVKKSELLKPVKPTLDTSILDEIEQRKYYTDDEDTVVPVVTVPIIP